LNKLCDTGEAAHQQFAGIFNQIQSDEFRWGSLRLSPESRYEAISCAALRLCVFALFQLLGFASAAELGNIRAVNACPE